MSVAAIGLMLPGRKLPKKRGQRLVAAGPQRRVIRRVVGSAGRAHRSGPDWLFAAWLVVHFARQTSERNRYNGASCSGVTACDRTSDLVVNRDSGGKCNFYRPSGKNLPDGGRSGGAQAFRRAAFHGWNEMIAT